MEKALEGLVEAAQRMAEAMVAAFVELLQTSFGRWALLVGMTVLALFYLVWRGDLLLWQAVLFAVLGGVVMMALSLLWEEFF